VETYLLGLARRAMMQATIPPVRIPRYPFACAPLPVLAPRPGTAWGHPPVRSITPGNTVSPHGLEARISPAELGDR